MHYGKKHSCLFAIYVVVYTAVQSGVPSFLKQMQDACAGYADYQLRSALTQH